MPCKLISHTSRPFFFLSSSTAIALNNIRLSSGFLLPYLFILFFFFVWFAGLPPGIISRITMKTVLIPALYSGPKLLLTSKALRAFNIYICLYIIRVYYMCTMDEKLRQWSRKHRWKDVRSYSYNEVI